MNYLNSDPDSEFPAGEVVANVELRPQNQVIRAIVNRLVDNPASQRDAMFLKLSGRLIQGVALTSLLAAGTIAVLKPESLEDNFKVAALIAAIGLEVFGVLLGNEYRRKGQNFSEG